MDNEFLLSLVQEAKNRGGGMLINLNDNPEAVVLTLDKYNDLLNQIKMNVLNSEEKQKILVTGGAGYIGTHIVYELLKEGYDVVVLDDLSTGKREHVPEDAKFVEGSIGDKNLLADLFATEDIFAVIHLAASLEVEESVKEPAKYFTNNVTNTETLLSAMKEAGVTRIIFSSSAAVYGEQPLEKFSEKTVPHPTNPYGYTKLLGEKVIKYFSLHAGFQSIVFRYFNACGAGVGVRVKPTHQSHLIPIVMEVAKGVRPYIVVYGSDYRTSDGSCVRDFVHVSDIAHAHVVALNRFKGPGQFDVFNIGTGKGSSVKEVINKSAEILNRIIPMEIGPRRAGDPAIIIADSTKIRSEWGLTLMHSDLENIITSTWNMLN